ncbi:MAG: aldose epimerase family protein [Bacteroidota bacterium]|nr:aldose epimerase family protein [Bacteroidota bacterium]MEC8238917.1 aldose epimerase family protein [Bacteroidota bacterium]
MRIPTIDKTQFGKTMDGTDVVQYILSNNNGMEVRIITYGGIITSWTAKDKNGNYKDIVLGYNTLAEYEAETPYFGALIGRYGNRIAKGKFSLDNQEYTLAVNNGGNHLHGGLKGFDKVVWDAKTIISDSTVSLELSYLSKDMEEGYPGNLETKVTYTLNNEDELSLSYEATTDKPTIVNLTQHSYFNLTADFNQDILDHEIVINADSFLPVDNALIPTGEFRDVNKTPFDFRKPKAIGQQISDKNTQLENGMGYDHCWVLNEQDKGLRFVASAYEPTSGRMLEVFSDEPGIQLYSGNFLDGTLPNKSNGTYQHRTGFCFETQHYPDSPNQKNFPSVRLNPGEKYNSKTVFRLSSVSK